MVENENGSQKETELEQLKQRLTELEQQNKYHAENKKRYFYCKRVVESNQDSIVLLDSLYRYKEANPAALALLQKTRPQVVGHSLSEILGQRAFERVKDILDQCLQGKTIQISKWFYKGEKPRYFTITYSPYQDENDLINGIIVISRDITSLKITQDELDKSRKRYFDLFENAPLPIIEVDFSGVKKELDLLWKDGIHDYSVYFRSHASSFMKLINQVVIKDINETTVRFFNFETKEQMRSRFKFAQYSHQNISVFPEIMIALAEGHLVHESELHIVVPDQDDRWLKLNLVVDPESCDTLEHVLISFSDLTGRKHAEAVLRQSEERFRTLFETMSQGVLYFDTEGRILQANPAARKILGIELRDIIGKKGSDPYWKIIYPDGSPVPETETPTLQALKTGQAIYHQLFGFYNHKLQEYRWVDVNAVPRFYGTSDAPSNVYFIFDDVSDKRREEQEKEALLFKTRQQTERMETIIQVSSSLRQAQKDEDVLRILTEQLQEGLKADATLLALKEGQALRLMVGSGSWKNFAGPKYQQSDLNPSLIEIMNKGTPLIFYSRKEMVHFDFPNKIKKFFSNIQACIFIPLKVLDNPFGMLVAGYQHDLDYSDDRIYLATTIGEIAGNTLHRMRVTSSLEQLASDRTRDLSTLYNIISVASGSFDMELALAQALEEILSTVKSQDGSILMVDESTQQFKIISEKGMEDSAKNILKTRLIKDVVEGWVVEQAEPLLISDIGRDKRFVLPERMQREIYVYLALPMRARGRVVGVITIMRKGQTFNVEEITLLGSIADHIGLVVDNLSLYQRAEKAAILEERSRLARDLHDSATQSLYSVTLYAEASRSIAQKGDLQQLNKYLDRLAQTSQQALSEMRLLVYELRPPMLEQDGLVVALRKRLEAVENRAGIQTQLDVNALITLDPVQEEHLFWIAVEALNNSLHHSEATLVKMQIRLEDNQFIFLIQDNGRGFNVNTARQGGGMGLNNMYQRAAKIGAVFDIQSVVGSGTTITLRLKYQPVTAQSKMESKHD
jgi:PAS domain S-box-containing protein